MTRRFLRLLAPLAPLARLARLAPLAPLAPILWATAVACSPTNDTSVNGNNGSPGAPEAQVAPEVGVRFVDSVRVSPDRYRVLETAPRVRLLAANWPPGVTDEPHSHPTGIWYALTDMSLRIEKPGLPPFERKISTGDSGVQARTLLHSVRNTGDRAAEVLMFEIEPRSTDPIGEPISSAPRSTSVRNNFQLIEQHGGTRLVLATFEPAQPAQKDRLHSHPASFWFALTDVDLRITEPGSEPVEIHLAAGESRLLEAVRGHTVVNLTTSVARLLQLEMP